MNHLLLQEYTCYSSPTTSRLHGASPAIVLSSLSLSSPNKSQDSSTTTLSLPLLGSLFDEAAYLSGFLSQIQQIQAPQDKRQKLASKFQRMEDLLKDSGFDSVGELLQILLYNPNCRSEGPDLQSLFHARAISWFLQ